MNIKYNMTLKRVVCAILVALMVCCTVGFCKMDVFAATSDDTEAVAGLEEAASEADAVVNMEDAEIVTEDAADKAVINAEVADSLSDSQKLTLILVLGGGLIIILAVVLTVVPTVVSSVASAVEDEEE